MSILLENLCKRLGGQLVVDRLSVEIAEGEFFVLLGPSGSGKSTVLRLISGLLIPDQGRIVLHGREVTRVPPRHRGVGFVFQNYSVFRHMSVAQNVEFGLLVRGVPAAERARRRDELLDLVGLAGLGGRPSDQLSGGQQQRVALARALAYRPEVLLLDEPFSALDVKIRGQLRRSLKEIQRRTGVTTVMVTHDQQEAFELADRVGLIDRGRLLELGTPRSLYYRPRSLFSATFVGAGNVLVGRAEEGQARFGPLSLPLPPDAPHENGSRVRVLIRPEQVHLAGQPEEGGLWLGQGEVLEDVFSGSWRRVRLRLPRLPGTRQEAPPAPFGEPGLLLDAEMPAEASLPPGRPWVGLRAWHILEQASPRLLVVDRQPLDPAGRGLVDWLVRRLGAEGVVLGTTPEAAALEPLRGALRDLYGGAFKIRVRQGEPAEETILELRENAYDDLLYLGPLDLDLAQILARADVPVTVLRGQRSEVRHLLICTAAGEPGKNDVRVGGRLAVRLGASVTLLHVPAGEELSPLARTHLERALGTLQGLGLEPRLVVRRATSAVQGILEEAREGQHDLVVVGVHLPSIEARDQDLTFAVLRGADRPVLVVPDLLW
jgi:sulfate transport system ATP-binding protein